MGRLIGVLAFRWLGIWAAVWSATILRGRREPVPVMHVIDENLRTARVVSDAPAFIRSGCQTYSKARVSKKLSDFSEGLRRVEALGEKPGVGLVGFQPDANMRGVNDLQQHVKRPVGKNRFRNLIFEFHMDRVFVSWIETRCIV